MGYFTSLGPLVSVGELGGQVALRVGSLGPNCSTQAMVIIVLPPSMGKKMKSGFRKLDSAERMTFLQERFPVQWAAACALMRTLGVDVPPLPTLSK